MSGFLSNPETHATGYWALGLVALGTAAACLILPGPFVSAMFGGSTTDSVVNSMVRSAGATLLTSATVKFTLKVRVCSSM